MWKCTKKRIPNSFNIAFVKADLDFLIDCVYDQIVWPIMGDKVIEGMDKFTPELEKMKSGIVSKFIIERILTHGKEGAVSGIIQMKNGKKYGISDFYEFNGAKGQKLKTITSYLIEI